jgi:hypothetical protein
MQFQEQSFSLIRAAWFCNSKGQHSVRETSRTVRLRSKGTRAILKRHLMFRRGWYPTTRVSTTLSWITHRLETSKLQARDRLRKNLHLTQVSHLTSLAQMMIPLHAHDRRFVNNKSKLFWLRQKIKALHRPYYKTAQTRKPPQTTTRQTAIELRFENFVMVLSRRERASTSKLWAAGSKK